MPLEEHDPTLAGLEAALAALAPMPGRIDRDALLFRAGQASVQCRGWIWPSAAAALGLVAVTLGALLIYTPAPAPVERIVRVPDPGPAPPPSIPEADLTPPGDYAPGSPHHAVVVRESPMTYLQLEKQIIRWGVDGMPGTQEALPLSGQALTRENLHGPSPGPTSLTSFFDLHSLFQ
jgi:hypothetical protein